MKTITISVTDRLHRRLCRMSGEVAGPAGAMGTITRNGLEAELARHETKIAALLRRAQNAGGQSADMAKLKELVESGVKAAPLSAEDQIGQIKDVLTSGEDPLKAFCLIMAIVETDCMAAFLLQRAETEAKAA